VEAIANYLKGGVKEIVMKKYQIALLVIIGIAALYVLFPKPAGSTCGFCPGPPAIERTESPCLGIKATWSDCPGCMDAGDTVHCIGILYSGEKECYTEVDGTWLKYDSCKTPPSPEAILAACRTDSTGCYPYSNNLTPGALEGCQRLKVEHCNWIAAIVAFGRNETAKATELCAKTNNQTACLEGASRTFPLSG